jgi:FMN phosphatase YigB (HAD superfamily)
MVRAIFFDFYSVWLPDIFSELLTDAMQSGPQVEQDLQDVVNKYFWGQVDATFVADSFRFKLGRPDIDEQKFLLKETDISPSVTSLMRNLHSHFVKLGVLANLGPQEYNLLNEYNAHNQLFEVIAGPYPMQLQVPLLTQEVFAKALQAIGEPPSSTLVVSGNPYYIQFASSIGIATLQFGGFQVLENTLIQMVSSEV